MTALENVAAPLELADAATLSHAPPKNSRGRPWRAPLALSAPAFRRRTAARRTRARPGPDPLILAADEPTGNLDSDTGASIIDLIFEQRNRRNATLVLVTHDATLAARCDRVVRLRSGRIDVQG